MNPFAGMKNKEAAGKSGNYLTDGEYELTLKQMIWKKKEEGGHALIVEFDVNSSTNPKHPQGCERSWFQNENKSFLPEAKAFLYAAVGLDADNEDHAKIIREKIDPACEEILFIALEKNTFKGRKFKCTVTTKKQKGDPTKDFSKHVFKPGDAPMQGLAA